MKEQAKKIIVNISQGKENILTTVVHLSETVNILKHGMELDKVSAIIRDLFMLDNVRIIDVTREVYFAANELGEDLRLDANDALAIDVMKINDIREIYSFDEDFDKIQGIKRLPII